MQQLEENKMNLFNFGCSIILFWNINEREVFRNRTK